ncbi:hypothetical protein [Hydrogenophaga luteola]|uniref:Uncharacterized protein n=1 Tax=Hydrogenophaga luteola TaxID=1591122 RepID=A0ABV7W4R7_9BURK
MSIFHYRAELLRQSPDGECVYKFFPDCVMAKEVSGAFSVSPASWQPEIIEAAGAEEKGLVSTDSRCVFVLTAKIKTEFEMNGVMPNEVLRIS